MDAHSVINPNGWMWIKLDVYNRAHWNGNGQKGHDDMNRVHKDPMRTGDKLKMHQMSLMHK